MSIRIVIIWKTTRTILERHIYFSSKIIITIDKKNKKKKIIFVMPCNLIFTFLLWHYY